MNTHQTTETPVSFRHSAGHRPMDILGAAAGMLAWWGSGVYSLNDGAHAADPVELLPTSQYARLGYVELGRTVAARADVALAASRPGDPLSLNYDGGNWVDAFRQSNFAWVNEAGLVAIGGDTSNRHVYDSDDFGATLALSPTGHVAFVGSPMHDGQGRDAGAVFFYLPLNDSWYPAGELPFLGRPFEYFGCSMSVGGFPLHIAVGACGSLSENQPPAVYLYRYNYNVSFGGIPLFSQTDVLALPVESDGDLGIAVATDGTWLAVGVAADSDPANQLYGAVYVFRFQNEYTRWVLHQTLRPDPSPGPTFFGIELAIGGPRNEFLAVGASAERVRDSRDGAVYVFQRRDERWVRTQKMTPPPPGNSYPALFGHSLDCSESVLVIGSGWSPMTTEHRGSVHAYRLDGDDWYRADAYWLTDDQGYHDHLGWSVAAAGETIVAGAPGLPSAPGPPAWGIRGGIITARVPVLGDADKDGDLDLSDASLLVPCVDGPAGDVGLDRCVGLDYDADGNVDLLDIAVFQRAFR